MQLKIDQKQRPFSHLPGTKTVLLGTEYQIEIFPRLLRFYSLENCDATLKHEFKLAFQAPFNEFTIFNDLEKHCITVSGKTTKGGLRYHIKVLSNTVVFYADRVPLNGLMVASKQVERNQRVDLFSLTKMFNCVPVEKLFLGNYKAQDSCLIKRRLDLTEILPLWHQMSQYYDVSNYPLSQEGTLSLLESCRLNQCSNKPEGGRQLWLNAFQAGFTGLFTPRLSDDDHLGLSPELTTQNVSPLTFLVWGGKCIRELFIAQRRPNQILILPHLLPELHAGSYINCQLIECQISIEWTKKTIRRCTVNAQKDCELHFVFPSNVRSYRLRLSNKESGMRKKTSEPLCIEKNRDYFFDNFL